MSGYQFIHVEPYSRIPSKNNKRQSARGVINEASRASDACPHISEIKAPILAYGVNPTRALELAEKQAMVAKDNLGRKFRKDGSILVGGVASYPERTDEIAWEDVNLQKWLHLTIEFLKNKYGDQLQSVVVHSDETFWHCHFYLVPTLDENNRLDIGLVHEGIAARNAVGHKSSAKIKLRAYSDAMRKFQDDYYELVGVPCGLTRDGPKRRRLTRKEWTVEKAASSRLATANAENQRIESALLLVNNIHDELNARNAQLKEKEQNLKALLEKFSRSFVGLKKILNFIKKNNDKKIERSVS